MSQEELESSSASISIDTLSSNQISWNFRQSRAESLGQSDSDRLRCVPSCAYQAPSLGVRDRIVVVVQGRDCNHKGYTDRKCVASSHCNIADFVKDPRLIPSPDCILQVFPSLREARIYWSQIFPDIPLEPLPSLCDHSPLLLEEWQVC